jgi:iron(III) transport system permease protein
MKRAEPMTRSAPTMAGGLRAGRGAAARDRTLWLVCVLAIILGVLTIPPLLTLIEGSLYTTNAAGGRADFTLDYYRRVFTDRQFFASLLNSVIFASVSAVLAIGSGGLVAWLVERTNTPWKPLAYLTAVISLGTPYILYVSAWLFLLGRVGPLNDFLRLLTGSARVFNVYSMGGMILVEGFLWSPLAFLLLASVFRSANADFEDAAQVAGASVARTLAAISLRLVLPAGLAILILIVVRSLEAFEVPALVGLPGGVKLLTTDIYLDMQKKVPPDMGHASAYSVVLLAVAAILLSFYARLTRESARFHTVTGRAFRPRSFDLGRGRWLGGIFLLWNFLLLLALPTGALLWLSLMPFSQSFGLAGLRALTLGNYNAVLHSPAYLSEVWKTLVMGAGAATVVMTLAILSGWLSVRHRPGAWLLDQLATIPLVFPGIVLGVALIQIYLAAPIPIYGTIWAFIIGFSIRYLPYGMRYATSSVLQIHPELEEAAKVAGGSLATSFRRVVLPLTRPAILSGWLFIFLIAARDVSLSVILASPSTEPVAVAMFDMWGNGQGTELAAFGLVWTAMMTVAAACFYLIGRQVDAIGFGR